MSEEELQREVGPIYVKFYKKYFILGTLERVILVQVPRNEASWPLSCSFEWGGTSPTGTDVEDDEGEEDTAEVPVWGSCNGEESLSRQYSLYGFPIQWFL